MTTISCDKNSGVMLNNELVKTAIKTKVTNNSVHCHYWP